MPRGKAAAAEEPEEESGDGTMTMDDRFGNEVTVEVGADGENPVSVNNPPAKAVLPSDEDESSDDADEDE